MGDKSAIEWTDATWNPGRLDQPLRWRKPRRIFVNSMSDLFHDEVPGEFIDQVFARMRVAGLKWGHTFQVLTKRPERMRQYVIEASERVRYLAPPNLPRNWYHATNWRWPLPNVWLGVSAENQRMADERIPLLLQTPAAVRFVSCEPLLGSVDLTNITADTAGGPEQWNVLDKVKAAEALVPDAPNTSIDWVIIGGESGPDARPMHPDWARSLRDQCQQADVPFFFKQWGEWTAGIVREDARYDGGRYVISPAPTAAELDLTAITQFSEHGRKFRRVGDEAYMVRVGKRRSGSLLDGVEWKQFPRGQ